MTDPRYDEIEAKIATIERNNLRIAVPTRRMRRAALGVLLAAVGGGLIVAAYVLDQQWLVLVSAMPTGVSVWLAVVNVREQNSERGTTP